MKLSKALTILAACHTRDDSAMGFVVEMSVPPSTMPCSQSEYIEAWRKVREFLHLVTQPKA